MSYLHFTTVTNKCCSAETSLEGRLGLVGLDSNIGCRGHNSWDTDFPGRHGLPVPDGLGWIRHFSWILIHLHFRKSVDVFHGLE